MGRNTWVLWTAGDQTFWDYLAQHGLGTTDLLKTIDSRRRATRFQDMGLVNQPGFQQATQADQYGLWLDTGEQEDGVDPTVYGRPSGIVGLRIYPQPAGLMQAARSRWDANRYYTDPNYYNDPQLARPYVVGMSCGFCHVSFNPEKPPDDPESPQWIEPVIHHRQPVLQSQPRVWQWSRGRQLCLPVVSLVGCGDSRHVVYRDGQPEQSGSDEPDLRRGRSHDGGA